MMTEATLAASHFWEKTVERPVMNPNFKLERPALQKRWYHRLWPAFFLLTWCFKLLARDVFGRSTNLKIELGSRFDRLIRGLLYRLLFAPLVVTLIACALVFSGTHPPAVATVIDPTLSGIFFEPVNFVSEDNAKLEGWLVPVLDARRVLEQKDKSLNEKFPAIILVHDYGASRQQMLPLVTPMHQAGFVVLVVELRGSAAGGFAGCTFGLKESLDVKAAVNVLRKRPSVDARRIGVLGVGTGATAALIAARHDAPIAAMVLDRPCHRFDDVLNEHLGITKKGFTWMNPICQWTFELSYGVNATDMDLDQCFRHVQSIPTLLYDATADSVLRPGKAKQIIDFLNGALHNVKQPQ
jgi:hypothetical protein